MLPPGVDGPPSVLEGVSVLGEESVLGERSETAESSEVSGSFPDDLPPLWAVRVSGCSGRAVGHRERRIIAWKDATDQSEHLVLHLPPTPSPPPVHRESLANPLQQHRSLISNH